MLGFSCYFFNACGLFSWTAVLEVSIAVARADIYIGHLTPPDHPTNCHIILTTTLNHAIMSTVEAIRYNKFLPVVDMIYYFGGILYIPNYYQACPQRKHTAEPPRTRPKQSKHSKHSNNNTSYEIHLIPPFPQYPNEVNSVRLSGMAVMYRIQTSGMDTHTDRYNDSQTGSMTDICIL